MHIKKPVILNQLVKGMRLALLLCWIIPASTFANNFFNNSKFNTISVSVEAYPTYDQALVEHAALKMLVKVTGNKDLFFNARIREKLKSIDKKYVAKYSIIQNVNPKQHNLVFSGKKISDLITQLNLDIWPRPRPQTLLWLVTENEDKIRSAYSDANLPELWQNALKRTYNDLGIQFILPALTLEERASMNLNNLWHSNDTQILKLSEAYQTENILIVTINNQDVNWSVNWRKYNLNRALEQTGQFYIDAIPKGIERLTKSIGHGLWIKDRQIMTSQQLIYFNIENVYNRADFKRVEKVIQNSRWLKSAFLIQIENGVLKYEIISRSNGEEYFDDLFLSQLFEWQNIVVEKQNLAIPSDQVSVINFRLKNATASEFQP